MATKAPPTPEKPAKVGLAARARALAGKLRSLGGAKRSVVLAVVGVAVLNCIVLAVLFSKRGARKAAGPAQVERIGTLDDALAAIDSANFDEARRIGRGLRARPRSPNETAGAEYVLGAAAAGEAEENWSRQRRALLVSAIGHLMEAQKLGFPEGRQGRGLFLLGKSLYMAGRVEESRPMLERALAAGVPHEAEVHRILVGAYRMGDGADLAKSLAHSEKLLALVNLTREERWNGLLAQSYVYWQSRDYEACGRVLRQIPAEAPVHCDALLMRGRLALHEARQAKQGLKADSTRDQRVKARQKFDEAIQLFRRAQEDPLATRTVRRSAYLIGIALLEMEDPEAALAQFERTRGLYLDSHEGLAAGLEEADLLRSMRRDDAAVAAYRRVLSSTTDPALFINPWIPRETFRARVLAAYRDYLRAESYERAIALAEELSPLFPRARTLELVADTYQQWGRKLLADSQTLSDNAATAARKKGRELLRRAGEGFGTLARLEFTTRRYPDALWRAAESNLEGQNYRSAATLLDEYLRSEPQRRRPVALVAMGEALLALGRLDESLVTLRECMDFHPRSAASYQARLLAAKAHLGQQQVAAAETVLRENINGELLTPQSKEWRDSLFALGELLAADGRYEEAIARLSEAIARFPDVRRDVDARYLIAEAYRKSAKVSRDKLAGDTSDTARAVHRRQLEKVLDAAVVHYQLAQDVLNRRREKTELTPLEKAVLRNSYFLAGATLFELGRYDDAIRVYSVATNRYQHDPEVLEAFVQIASCHRRMARPIEARGAIQQAKVVLGRLKTDDASFTQNTNFPREQWTAMLDWLAKM